MAADVFEGNDCFCIQVDLPGVDMSTLDVDVNNGFLNIKVERKRLEDQGDTGVHRWNERQYGLLQRSIPIPAEADEKTADAKIENGVLSVSLAKTKGAGTKKLLIKEAGKTSASTTTARGLSVKKEK